ncbi:Nif3-like dinuclear metal center hexameric protein [Frankia sp. AiPs1]|uniref:Nif3-like dinuclear metal center hexameric protein n=1 Tax=Frankia sp. AiPs1 TaxID=573493 RepID=UPI002042D203|nr:Nif3-like dinuclear metal center hexameric protein [Frankia sp. AiPs1]MCM3922851.1 Nif3-like dinuclear metal center hexameric protein [Frankia sp. AiPs1]
MGLIAGWCLRYRWIVVGTWLIVLVAGGVLAGHEGARYHQAFGVAGTDSQLATDALATVVPGGLPDTEMIVVRARDGDINAPAVRQRIAAMTARVARLPGVATAIDPYGPAGSLLLGVEPVARDGHAAIVGVVMKGAATSPDLAAVRRLITTARAYDGPDLQVEMSGIGTTMIVQGDISVTPIALAVAAATIILCLVVRAPGGIAVCALVAAATAGGVRATGAADRLVRRVAVCGGSGGELVGAARAAGADVLVTADGRHHYVLDAVGEHPIAVVDVAHWASEWPWLAHAAARLEAGLRTRGRTVSASVSAIVTDPWRLHVPSR